MEDWQNKYFFLKKDASQEQQRYFSVETYGCERWSIRKAKRRKLDAFELWCWRKLLLMPSTAKRTNHLKLDKVSQLTRRINKEARAKILDVKASHWKTPWCWEESKVIEKEAEEDRTASGGSNINIQEFKKATKDRHSWQNYVQQITKLWERLNNYVAHCFPEGSPCSVLSIVN